MTNKNGDRAEEVAEEIIFKVFTLRQIPLSHQDFKNMVTQALRDFGDERVKEAHRTIQGLQTVLQRASDLTNGFDDGREIGRAEALEEAARKFELLGDTHMDKWTGYEIARAIRQPSRRDEE